MNTYKIKLNANFYQKNAIERAIIDFKDIAKIASKEENGYFRVELTPKDDTPNIMEEFTNYAFGIGKNKRVQ